MAQLTDEELVAAILQGEEDRFRELVLRYQNRIVNYLYRLLRNLDEAHDLAQEVFLRVYGALDRFDPSYKFSTWLFRVAQNAAIDRIRKRRLKLVSINRPESEDGTGGIGISRALIEARTRTCATSSAVMPFALPSRSLLRSTGS